MSVRIWVISDTHFGHENMYKFVGANGLRVRRRFEHAQEADECMYDLWAERVRPDDHIYHLGDVAMNFAPYVRRIKALPGHKRLLLGNHDKGKLAEYIAAGFEKIASCRMWDRKTALLTHIPVHPDSTTAVNVHGHIHERTLPGRYANVCVEHTDYAPVLLEEIIERFKHT